MSDTEETKKSGYRVEYAASARAKCKGMSLSQFRSVHTHHSWLIVERVFRSQTVCRYSRQRLAFCYYFYSPSTSRSSGTTLTKGELRFGYAIPGHLPTVGV